MQPGETINPGGSSPPSIPEPPAQQDRSQGWEYKPEASGQAVLPPQSQGEVSWTASEYIAHHKNLSWFVLLGLGTAAVVILIFLLTRDVVASVVICLVAVSFGVMGARPPRTLPYRVGHGGITIGEKFYPFAMFKSFSVLDEGAISSILLLPMKRYMTGLSVYYPPEQEQQIVEMIGLYLPHEQRSPDAIDRLMSRIRF